MNQNAELDTRIIDNNINLNVCCSNDENQNQKNRILQNCRIFNLNLI